MAFDRKEYERLRHLRRKASGELKRQYARRRDVILATCKAKRAGAGGDSLRETQRAYKWRAKDVIAARLKANGFKCQKAWKAAHRERMLLAARELVARRIAEGHGSAAEKLNYQRIWRESDHTCGICGRAVEFTDLNFDHKIPLSRGGPHVESNIQITHAHCNFVKGAKVAA